MPMKYNLRFIEAFLKTKIKDWPHQGPIIIKEVDPASGEEEQFLIHNWCIVQKQEGDGKGLEDLEFDYDVYKILRRFMYKDNFNRQHISQLQDDIPTQQTTL
jgi:DNA polymerase-3 subunit epsilon